MTPSCADVFVQLVMWFYIIVGFLVLAATYFYWFHFRDDGGYSDDKIVLNIKPSNFTLPKKTSAKVSIILVRFANLIFRG